MREAHLREVGQSVWQAGHNTALNGFFLEVLEYAIHLVIVAIGVVRNPSNLITVSLGIGEPDQPMNPRCVS